MNIDYLRIFHEVAKAGSISKIAKNSHISQPALSQQIQRLEDSLNLKLLERSNKGVNLTDSGYIVEKYARQIIKMYDNMIKDLDDAKSNNSNIRIGACNIFSEYSLPCSLYNAKEKYPQLNIEIFSTVSSEVEQSVVNDLNDIGFIYGKPKDNSLKSFQIGSDRMLVVSGYKSKIPTKLSINDLCKNNFILLQKRFKLTESLLNYLESLGFHSKDLNVMFYLDSVESIKASVIRGYGLAVLPYMSVKKEIYAKQIKEIKIPNFNMDYDIHIIHKKNDDICNKTKTMINFFKSLTQKSFC